MSYSRLFVEVPEVQAQIAALIDAGDYEQALWALGGGMSSFYTREDVLGHSLYLRGFDLQITRLGESLRDASTNDPTAPRTANMLVLSEFYDFGGHSKVSEDLVETLGGAAVVLTDLFASYRKGRLSAEDAAKRMRKATIHCLKESSFLGKVRELQALFRTVRPACVLLMTHHPDPLPFVAAASLPDSVTKVFFHHGDHQPSLGCTLHGYVHVDFSEHLQKICHHHLARPAIHLPLCVPDQGIKAFSKPTPETLSVVSSGNKVKYRIDGPLAYPIVITEILRSFGGDFWHIGTLDASWRDVIANALRGAGIPEARFNYIPNVPSLWQTLKEIDAHAFLGSFPIHGSRTSVEAQGCGYPILYYAGGERSPLLRYDDLYASRDLGWASVAELIVRLKSIVASHERRVAAARDRYLGTYSFDRFSESLAVAMSAKA